MMNRIISTTDGNFVGTVFDNELPITLNGETFAPDKVLEISATVTRYANSSYVLDAEEI